MVISLPSPNEKLNARIGPKKIQIELIKRYNIKLSVSTIYRILKDADLIKPRKKRWQKRRELAAYRRRKKALRRWQVDAKHLRDILEIYHLIRQGEIPKYQYPAWDVVSGTTFIAYADELSVINSMRFIFLLLRWLKKYGVPLEEVEITTDKGSEFIGSVDKKGEPGFSLVVTSFGSRHTTIPVGRPEWNGSVENFHGRIEAEFYEVECFKNRQDFLSKAFTFNLYFNLEPSKIETGLTPREVVFTKTHIKDNQFFSLAPVILDEIDLFSKDLICRDDVPEHHRKPL